MATLVKSATRSVMILLLVAVITAPAGAGDQWLQVSSTGGISPAGLAQAQTPVLDVLGYDDEGIDAVVATSGVGLLPRQTAAGEFVVVTWPDAAPWGAVGAPALPVVRRLFAAPAGAEVWLSANRRHRQRD